MNKHEHHISKTRFEGLFDLLERCDFQPGVERVALDGADGRICAEDVHAVNTLPNALTSALDAIAVRFADFEDGIPDTSSWTRGEQYDFCNTGIGMPEGYDTAIAIEQTRFDENGVLEVLRAPEQPGEGTVEPGSSMREGDLLVERGRRISPALVGLAAQGGHTELPVYAKPRVAFIPSGNELVAAGEKLPRGCSVECNSLMFAAKLRSWGGLPVVNDICPDDWDTIEKALTHHLQTADIVVVNAGSSKGTDDLTVEILEQLGEVLNHEFDHGPGKHSSLSVVDGKPVVGIAGPPMGAEFCLDFYVKPLVDAYFGLPFDKPHTMWATLTQDMPASPRPVEVVRRVSLERSDDGQLLATPLPHSMKPVLKMCDAADAFLILDKDSYGYRAGEEAVVELRYPYTLPA